MAHSKRKKAKIVMNPKASVAIEKNPDAFYSLYPSWKFNQCDKDEWSPLDSKVNFQNEILPSLISYEGQTWDQILIKSQNKNHPINPKDLNSKAQKRIEQLNLAIDDIYSLRLNGTHRLYGFIAENGTFYVLWYDSNHGDNQSCVCRSYKKHT